MKKFVELIQRIHQERFQVVMNKITAEKIPVAFLSVAPLEDAVGIVKNLRAQNLNVINLITHPYPPLDVHTDLEFEVLTVQEFLAKHLRPTYIFAVDFISARFAIKYIPDCKVLSLNYLQGEEMYNAFMNHLVELKEVYESLIDEESKKTFFGYWLGRTSNQLGEIIHTHSAHYLTAGFIPEPGAIVIDCGVFDGGTATIFSEMGYKVYGFELDENNFNYSKKIAAEKNFVVENLGLGSFKHEVKYNPSGSGSQLNPNGTLTAQVTTIDAYVRENNIPRVDFIKWDVEGAELDILKGAKTTIARWKPILAISAYHKPDDFWVLMNFIKSIRPDYEFALRQGAESPEEEPANFVNKPEIYFDSLGLEPDLRNWYEAVLFAR